MTERHEPTSAPVILCVTPDGCECGAPAATPSGMHHTHCPANPKPDDGRPCRVCRLPERTAR